MKLIKRIQSILIVMCLLIISCSCAVNEADGLSVISSPKGTIEKNEAGFSVTGFNFGISEQELLAALDLKEDDFEKTVNSQTKGTRLVLHKNPVQWDEINDSGFVSMYHFSDKGKLYRVDYQIYWNAKPVQKEDKWLLEIKETDGKEEIKKAQNFLKYLTEKLGDPIAPVTLENLNQPDGKVMAQWFDLESETDQKGFLAVFYRQTNPEYDNKEIYGVDITLSAEMEK